MPRRPESRVSQSTEEGQGGHSGQREGVIVEIGSCGGAMVVGVGRGGEGVAVEVISGEEEWCLESRESLERFV
jgi:hypothetical protein